MKLLILDRDGVINQDSDDYVKSLDEWIPIDGSIAAIARLSQAGWTVAVATNQSGLARGYYSEQTLVQMHEHMHQLVAQQGGELGLVVYCPHGPEAGCKCRKPLPGLLQQIAQHYAAELEGVWFVGDSLRDLEAALAVNAQPVLVRTGKGQKTAAKPLPEGTLIFTDLAEVADQLLS
ncbi:D-glycero-beta-D-manno-heptose 1,7-bisphosphate 7-phosphatase [Pseudomonas sp. F1_0610]|uniref:D-glycero-beta-D-manno-heptose 1,7-bisphosphate 7-phosphatase n=1 Tax=Pseudomonas sp. F1_0610 TaxID=3114284 RepID=UPI0039C0E521